MKVTVTETMFIEAFEDYNRSNSFSTDGRVVLFNYLGELDREAQEETELDVIAICCEWCEHTFEEFFREYDIEEVGDEDKEKLRERIEEYLQDRTSIAGFTNNSVVFAAF